jgi:hypothetical protein
MSTKKILVAELEVELQTLQLEKLDVHEWDIYTYPLTYAQFKLMFYSQEGDPNSFSFAPYPTLKNTTGYDQEELQRQNWVALRDVCNNIYNAQDTNLVNYFQLGGRQRNTDVSGRAGIDENPPNQYGTSARIASRYTEGTGDDINKLVERQEYDDAHSAFADLLGDMTLLASLNAADWNTENFENTAADVKSKFNTVVAPAAAVAAAALVSPSVAATVKAAAEAAATAAGAANEEAEPVDPSARADEVNDAADLVLAAIPILTTDAATAGAAPTATALKTLKAEKYTQNAYFIGDPLTREDVKNFWAEEVIMNQMETDLALSREHWTETSKHKIQQELDFLVFGDAKVNFSRDLASLEEEIANAGASLKDAAISGTAKANTVSLLLVLVVTNPHAGVKNNHLNIHFKVRTNPDVEDSVYDTEDENRSD